MIYSKLKVIISMAFAVGAIFLQLENLHGQVLPQSYLDVTVEAHGGGRDISTPEAFLSYLGSNRRNVSVVSFSVKENGQIDLREPLIAYNVDEPMSLQSLGKVIHLAAYAKAVSAGEISPDRFVTVAEWENYYLPGADGFAHAVALQELGIPVTEYGYAVDPNTPVTVRQMVRAMIRYSDNAVPDWLLANIPRRIFREVIEHGGLFAQEFPFSFLGGDLSYENHEKGLLSAESVRELKRMPPNAYRALVKRLEQKFQDPEWRQAELQWRLVNIEQTANPTFLRTVVDAVSVKGTARDYASLMARIATGTFLSREISEIMQNILEESILVEELGQAELFSVYGEKIGGSSGGFVTNAGYGIPSSGDYAGKKRITVLFQRRIDLNILAEQFQSLIPFRFVTKLARERVFAKEVRLVFNGY